MSYCPLLLVLGSAKSRNSVGHARDGLVRVACHSGPPGRLAQRLKVAPDKWRAAFSQHRSLSLCSSTWPARTLMVAAASNPDCQVSAPPPGGPLRQGPSQVVHGLEQGATAAARGMQLI